jgi:hypothetical protein
VSRQIEQGGCDVASASLHISIRLQNVKEPSFASSIALCSSNNDNLDSSKAIRIRDNLGFAGTIGYSFGKVIVSRIEAVAEDISNSIKRALKSILYSSGKNIASSIVISSSIFHIYLDNIFK